MKKVLLMLSGLLPVVVSAAALDGETLLRKALDTSVKASFSAKYVNTADQLISFSRFYDPELGVLKKGAYLPPDDKPYSYLEYQFYQLPEGIFSAKDTLVHPLTFAMLLNTPDDLFRQISESDWQAATYSVEDWKFKGDYAHKITMTLPEEYLSAPRPHQEILHQRQNNRYPAVRVFIVLEKNMLIVSRKHYNSQKELVYSLEFQEVDISNPPTAEDFVLPGKPQGEQLLDEWEAIHVDSLAEAELKDQDAAKKLAQTKRENFFKKFFRGGMTPIVWTILGISVFCLLFGLCWKRFAKK